MFKVAGIAVVFSTLLQVSPSESSTPVGIVALVTQIGLSGVFLWQWRDERNQRVKRDDQLIEVNGVLIPIATRLGDILSNFDHGVSQALHHTQAQPAADDRLSITLDLILQELRGRG